MLKLKLHTDTYGNLRYGTSLYSRLIYALFALVLGIGWFTYYREGSTSFPLFPALIFLFLLVGALYLESWEVKKDSGRLVYRYGLVVLHRKMVYEFEKIESFELAHFRKGARNIDTKVKSRANKLYVTLSVVCTDGTKKDIEIVRLKQSAGTTEQAARAIASACGKPLEIDREFDSDAS